MIKGPEKLNFLDEDGLQALAFVLSEESYQCLRGTIFPVRSCCCNIFLS